MKEYPVAETRIIVSRYDEPPKHSSQERRFVVPTALPASEVNHPHGSSLSASSGAGYLRDRWSYETGFEK
jgi:hypothetical protein